MLLCRVVSKFSKVDGSFSDSIISDGVFVHDLDFEDVIRSFEVEGLVPDWSFSGLILCFSRFLFFSKYEDTVGILRKVIVTILEKNSVSWVGTALITLNLMLII